MGMFHCKNTGILYNVVSSVHLYYIIDSKVSPCPLWLCLSIHFSYFSLAENSPSCSSLPHLIPVNVKKLVSRGALLCKSDSCSRSRSEDEKGKAREKYPLYKEKYPCFHCVLIEQAFVIFHQDPCRK